MIKIILGAITLLLSIPLGLFLAYLTRDELVGGRKYFKLIIFISGLTGIIFLFFNLEVSLSLFFIFITTLICLKKSYDKNFIV